ncbi:MAG: DUF1844 domain-containing protein [Bdellovibrionales bacterium]|jgi:hypothetical protein|nr:DUF1844 domain-containing protein [Bdellovibrionales bacterium]
MSDISNQNKNHAAEAGFGQNFEASLSTLVLSIASSAAMALGLAPHPVSGKTEKDLKLARFNIDLLVMLDAKTKGNRSADEDRFLSTILQDLKMKFIQAN